MNRLRFLAAKARVMALLVLGRQAPALRVLDAMRLEFPGNAYVLASIAHLQAQAGRRDAAVVTLDELLRAHPAGGGHWFNHGFVLEELGDYERAEASFRRATELAPQLDRAWYGLGLVLIRLGRSEEAVAALKRNTQLQPMSPFGWYQLARVHADRQEQEEARRIIRHLRQFEPKVADQLERETGLRVEHAG